MSLIINYIVTKCLQEPTQSCPGRFKQEVNVLALEPLLTAYRVDTFDKES